MDTEYLILSMFFLFAFMFQDAQFMLYFAIPIKGKWLAWIDAAYFAYAIVHTRSRVAMPAWRLRRWFPC